MGSNRWLKVLRVVMGIAFVFFGAVKFIRPEVHAENFSIFPAFFMPLTGIAEAVLGIALLAAFQTKWAAYALALIMGGAVFSHIMIGLSPKVGPSIVLGLLTLVLGYYTAREPQAKGVVRQQGW
ncbi:MAG: DoxX family protein [Bacillota bacterium]